MIVRVFVQTNLIGPNAKAVYAAVQQDSKNLQKIAVTTRKFHSFWFLRLQLYLQFVFCTEYKIIKFVETENLFQTR